MIGLPTPNIPVRSMRAALLQAVQFHLNSVEKLLTPPLVPDTGASLDPTDPACYVGVPVATFPRWMVCPTLPNPCSA